MSSLPLDFRSDAWVLTTSTVRTTLEKVPIYLSRRGWCSLLSFDKRALNASTFCCPCTLKQCVGYIRSLLCVQFLLQKYKIRKEKMRKEIKKREKKKSFIFWWHSYVLYITVDLLTWTLFMHWLIDKLNQLNTGCFYCEREGKRR